MTESREKKSGEKLVAKKKLYAYVDETGQDTKGLFFLVAVIIAGQERDALRQRLAKIEQASGKYARKWTKTRPEHRVRYIREIISVPALFHCLFYSLYRDTKTYVDLSILSTAKALIAAAGGPYEATILVDGLGRTERHRYAAGLRKLNITVRKVRGVKDESDEFIRLADAIAGFVRGALEGSETMRQILNGASDVIRKI